MRSHVVPALRQKAPRRKGKEAVYWLGSNVMKRLFVLEDGKDTKIGPDTRAVTVRGRRPEDGNKTK
jgi:hypothetical protein